MKKVHIVNMKDKRSVTRPNTFYAKGFAIYVDDLGFLSLDGKTVYMPRGGRKTLKSMIDEGLFDNPRKPGWSYIYC